MTNNELKTTGNKAAGRSWVLTADSRWTRFASAIRAVRKSTHPLFPHHPYHVLISIFPLFPTAPFSESVPFLYPFLQPTFNTQVPSSTNPHHPNSVFSFIPLPVPSALLCLGEPIKLPDSSDSGYCRCRDSKVAAHRYKSLAYRLGQRERYACETCNGEVSERVLSLARTLRIHPWLAPEVQWHLQWNFLEQIHCAWFVPCLWVPVTTAWRVIRLRMEERPPICRVAANKLNKQSRTADKGWSSSLGFGWGANNSSPWKIQMLRTTRRRDASSGDKTIRR